MSKGKFEQKGRGRRRRRAFSSKPLALVIACVLLVGGIVGGTVAWLTAQTNPMVNTFSTSDIDVTLTETTTNYKMVPGWTIDKDPKVTVLADSEDCYLFIKVEESTDLKLSDYIAYAIDEGWTQLKDTGDNAVSGVYYRIVDDASEKNTAYTILGKGKYKDADNVEYTWSDNEVLTKPEVTKEMMDAVKEDNKPTLSFTAYAVQLWKSNKPTGAGATAGNVAAAQFTPYEAWSKISTTATN